MDKRLNKMVGGGKFHEHVKEYDVFLVDTYNQSFYTDIAPTIKNRIDQNNNIRIVETIKWIMILEQLPLNADDEGLCRPLKAQYYKNGKANFEYTGSYGATGAMKKEGSRFRIRKLTPRECFRLMGVTDANIDVIQQTSISNCQQYKMAGNSIVVDCLEYIFDKLFVHKESEDKQLSLF